MASEKITAIVESVKTMTSARSSAFLLLLLLLPLLLALLLPLRKRRPSSTSSSLRLALPRCRSSSWSRRSPVWA